MLPSTFISSRLATVRRRSVVTTPYRGESCFFPYHPSPRGLVPEEREKKKKGHPLLDLFNILTVQLVHALEYRQPFYVGFSARRLGEKLIFFFLG